MHSHALLRLAALAVLVVGGNLDAFCQRAAYSFPGSTWEQADLARQGWSVGKLAQGKRFWATLPSSSVLVVHEGRVVAEWGDPGMKIKASSVRKSLLSALYGIYLSEGKLSLDRTLADLGMDDDPPLNAQERTATVRMALESRSGVYHSFVAGTPAMRTAMPQRGSHPPGTFWYYNNWDFNVLGAIFEKQTRTPIGLAFRDRIAVPLQMQDFCLDDMYYLRASPAIDSQGQSRYPAYHFRLTARDMARFGYLYLRRGNWDGKQVIPSSWIQESTASYSNPVPAEGYGYLWWINGLDLPVSSYSAQGALAKYIVVLPEREMVVVYQNHTELPDNAQSMSNAEVKLLPTISKSQFTRLLKLVLASQHF